MVQRVRDRLPEKWAIDIAPGLGLMRPGEVVDRPRGAARHRGVGTPGTRLVRAPAPPGKDQSPNGLSQSGYGREGCDLRGERAMGRPDEATRPLLLPHGRNKPALHGLNASSCGGPGLPN